MRSKSKHYLILFYEAQAARLFEYEDETDLSYGEALYKDIPYLTFKAPSAELAKQKLRQRKIPILDTLKEDVREIKEQEREAAI